MSVCLHWEQARFQRRACAQCSRCQCQAQQLLFPELSSCHVTASSFHKPAAARPSEPKTVGLLDGRRFLQALEDPLRAHSCSLNLAIASHSLLPLGLSPWSHGSLAEGSRFLPEEHFGSVVFWVWLAHTMFQMLLPPPPMAVVMPLTERRYSCPLRPVDLPALLCLLNTQFHFVVGLALGSSPSLRVSNQAKPGPPRPLESTGGFRGCPPDRVLQE